MSQQERIWDPLAIGNSNAIHHIRNGHDRAQSEQHEKAVQHYVKGTQNNELCLGVSPTGRRSRRRHLQTGSEAEAEARIPCRTRSFTWSQSLTI